MYVTEIFCFSLGGKCFDVSASEVFQAFIGLQGQHSRNCSPTFSVNTSVEVSVLVLYSYCHYCYISLELRYIKCSESLDRLSVVGRTPVDIHI